MRKLLLLIVAALLITTPALAVKPVDKQSYEKAKEELKTEGSVPLIDAVRVSVGKPHLEGFPISVKIVGGTPVVRIADFPWQVSLQANQSPSNLLGHFCGGSLVKPNWVVTAAHCVDSGTAPDQINVLTGTIDLRSGGVKTSVVKIIMHPEYGVGMNNNNDIALVKLAGQVAMSPLPLITQEIEASAADSGATATITGWGFTKENGQVSPTLQEAKVSIVDRQTCNSEAVYNGEVTDSMICAGKQGGGVDSCQGDSGGPLMVKNSNGAYILAGIVSWGQGCARAGLPGVYTRVAKFSEWVNQTIEP